MKSRHCYVVLIDLPEALPFAIKKQLLEPGKLKEVDGESKKSEKELMEFMQKLEKNFKEEFSFIGEDIVGEKFYKRFLFSKSGFMEVMYQAPVAVIAHFLDIRRANLFAESLKKTLDQKVKDRKLSGLLQNMVEVNTEKVEPLTYEKWSKLRDIRENVR